MNRKGGYQIIDLKDNDLTGASFTISGIYDALEGNYNKAILLSGIVIGGVEYDDVFTTPKVVSSNYVLDAYGYTLTIDDDDLVTMGVVTTLMENIVDADGNNRFVEGDLELESVNGLTFTYSKWSLSGTHLMIVLAGNVSNGTTLNYTDWCYITLPSYIMNKIYPIVASRVNRMSFSFFASDATTQTGQIELTKSTDTILTIAYKASTTLTDDRSFRIQFDLLIDNE